MTLNEQAAEALIEADRLIEAEAPGLYDTTSLAERVGLMVGVSAATAKRYLRAAVDAGRLLELKPNRGFRVTLPGEGAHHFRVVVENYRPQRLIIVEGETTPYPVPSHYGPGRTTYMTTPAQAKALVDAAKEKAKAAKEEEQARREAEKKAERAEIKRREPGLINELRRLRFALTSEWLDVDNQVRAGARLLDFHPKGKPVEEQRLDVDVTAAGTAVSVLREILDVGLRHHLNGLPVVVCQHCGQRILSTKERGEVVWWHVESTDLKCKGGETSAGPKEVQE